MSTTTLTPNFRIVTDSDGFFVIEGPDGMLLRDTNGNIRRFITRNAARKRVSRERSGNFHK